MAIFVKASFLSYRAMALYPFILIQQDAYRYDRELVQHELIHHRQQLELLILPFYLLYAGHYLINLVRFRDNDRAYRHIIFEREAYAMDTDIDYLQRRKYWAFGKY